MTFLDDITSTEKKAQQIIVDAQEKAKEQIETAEVKQQEELSQLSEDYAQKESRAIQDGQAEADVEGKKMVEEGKKEASTLQSVADKNEKKTIDLILKAV